MLTKWLKKEGDKVEKGEPLFELETDKLNTVVEATESGVLRKILVPEGTEVAILKEVGVIGGAEEDISALAGGASALVEKGEAAPEAEKTAVPCLRANAAIDELLRLHGQRLSQENLGSTLRRCPQGKKDGSPSAMCAITARRMDRRHRRWRRRWPPTLELTYAC